MRVRAYCWHRPGVGEARVAVSTLSSRGRMSTPGPRRRYLWQNELPRIHASKGSRLCEQPMETLGSHSSQSTGDARSGFVGNSTNAGDCERVCLPGMAGFGTMLVFSLFCFWGRQGAFPSLLPTGPAAEICAACP